MTSQTIVPQKKHRNQTQSRFQRLWSEAEALEKENLELETTLDALVSRIDKEVFQAERRLGAAIYQAVDHQLDFAKRKSLLKWQRAELKAWIDENLSELISMGMIDDAMRDKLALLKATEIGVEIDLDSDISPADQLDKHLLEQEAADNVQQTLHNGHDDVSQCDLFDEEDTGKPDATEELSEEELLAELLRKFGEQFEQVHQSQRAEVPAARRGNLSDAVFKRLFRQTATALHPDKESDAKRRAEKHDLMAQLLKARKEFDLVTILRLHETHAAATSQLSSEDQQELEVILVEYLDKQQQRMDEIIDKSAMHRMAFSEFYHKQPRTITRRINAHIKKVETRMTEMQSFVSQVKTLKTLKDILAARYEAFYWRRDW